MTERGRMINLKQASYKPLRIVGHARPMPESEVGGLQGTVFLGVGGYVADKDIGVTDVNIGVFVSRHSTDMKFTEVSTW